MARISSLVAEGVIIDSLGREWDPIKHPRGRDGKFIRIFRLIRAFLNHDDSQPWATGQVVAINPNGSVRMKVDHVVDASNNHYIGHQVDLVPANIESINEKAVIKSPHDVSAALDKYDLSMAGMHDFFDAAGLDTKGLGPNGASSDLDKTVKAMEAIKSGQSNMAHDFHRYYAALYMKEQSGEGKAHSDADFMDALESLGVPADVIDDTPDGMSGLKWLADKVNESRSPNDNNKDSIEWFDEVPPLGDGVIREAKLKDSDVRVQWHADGTQSIVWPDGTVQQHDKNKGSLLLAAQEAHTSPGIAPPGSNYHANSGWSWENDAPPTNWPIMPEQPEEVTADNFDPDSFYQITVTHVDIPDDMSPEIAADNHNLEFDDSEVEPGDPSVGIDPHAYWKFSGKGSDLEDFWNEVTMGTGSHGDFIQSLSPGSRPTGHNKLQPEPHTGPDNDLWAMPLTPDPDNTDIPGPDSEDWEHMVDADGPYRWGADGEMLRVGDTVNWTTKDQLVTITAFEKNNKGVVVKNTVTGKKQALHRKKLEQIKTPATPTPEPTPSEPEAEHTPEHEALIVKTLDALDEDDYYKMYHLGVHLGAFDALHEHLSDVDDGATKLDPEFVRNALVELSENTNVDTDTPSEMHYLDALGKKFANLADEWDDIAKNNDNGSSHGGDEGPSAGEGGEAGPSNLDSESDNDHTAADPADLVQVSDKGFTPEESQAIGSYQRHYATYSAQKINHALRNDAVSPEMQERIDLLDSALEKSTLKQDTVLYRAIRPKNSDVYGPEQEKEFNALVDALVPGATIDDPAYLSAATNDNDIKEFLGVSRNVLIKINAPEGTHALAVEDAGNHPTPSVFADENELLLPRGSKLHIDSVEKSSGLKTSSTGKPSEDWIVTASVVPNETPVGDPTDALEDAENDPDTIDVPEAPTSNKFEVLDDPGTSGDGYWPGTHLWGKYGAAGVLVRHVDDDGTERFLFVQRGPIVSSNKGKWQLPGGALDSKENDYQGTARELSEELSPPDGYLDKLTPVGEVKLEHESGWHYTNIAANASEMFDPTVDGTETGDAKWYTKDEIAQLDLHPALVDKLDELMGKFDNNESNTPAPEPTPTPGPEVSGDLPGDLQSKYDQVLNMWSGEGTDGVTIDDVLDDIKSKYLAGEIDHHGAAEELLDFGNALQSDGKESMGSDVKALASHFEDAGDFDTPDAQLEQEIDEGHVIDATGWSKVGGQGGSNIGGMFEDPNGKRYYVKKGKTPDHARNEALAAALYEEAGIPASQQLLADTPFDGALGTASPEIPGAKQDLKSHLNDPEYMKKLQDGFAVDAWLANWDVAGLVYDNVVTDENGDPVRVDPGGALYFRAQGAPKPGAAWGPNVGEFDTLRDPHMNPTSAKIFGSMTDDEIKASAQHVIDITPDKIDKIVDSMGFGDGVIDPDKMKETLKARRKFIADKFGLELPEEHINEPGEPEAKTPQGYSVPGEPGSKEFDDHPGWGSLNKAEQEALYNVAETAPHKSIEDPEDTVIAHVTHILDELGSGDYTRTNALNHLKYMKSMLSGHDPADTFAADAEESIDKAIQAFEDDEFVNINKPGEEMDGLADWEKELLGYPVSSIDVHGAGNTYDAVEKNIKNLIDKSNENKLPESMTIDLPDTGYYIQYQKNGDEAEISLRETGTGAVIDVWDTLDDPAAISGTIWNHAQESGHSPEPQWADKDLTSSSDIPDMLSAFFEAIMSDNVQNGQGFTLPSGNKIEYHGSDDHHWIGLYGPDGHNFDSWPIDWGMENIGDLTDDIKSLDGHDQEFAGTFNYDYVHHMRDTIPKQIGAVKDQFPEMSDYQAKQYRNAGFALQDVIDSEKGSQSWTNALNKAIYNLEQSGPAGQNKLDEVKKWKAAVTGEQEADHISGTSVPAGSHAGGFQNEDHWTKQADGSWEETSGKVVPAGSVGAKVLDIQSGHHYASWWDHLDDMPPAPPGATANNHGMLWTKNDNGLWVSPDGVDVEPSGASAAILDANYHVEHDTESPTPETPSGTENPEGTVVMPPNPSVSFHDADWSKQSDGSWKSANGASIHPGETGYYTLESKAWNGAPPGVEAMLDVIWTKHSNGSWIGPDGTVIKQGTNAYQTFDAVHKQDWRDIPPAPTGAKYFQAGIPWVKQEDGTWLYNTGAILSGSTAKYMDGMWNVNQASGGDFSELPGENGAPHVSGAPVGATVDQGFGAWKKNADGSWTNLDNSVTYQKGDSGAQFLEDEYAKNPTAPTNAAPTGSQVKYLGADWTKQEDGSWELNDVFNPESVYPGDPTYTDLESAYAGSKENESTPAPPTKPGPFRVGADGKAMYIGDKVKSTTDGKTYTVKGFENNDKGVIVVGDDGKKRARHRLKLVSLEPDAAAPGVVQANPSQSATPPPPKVNKTPPKPTLEPDPSSPWFGKDKPEPPTKEEAGQEPWVLDKDAWIAEAEQIYNDTPNTGSASLQQSSITWGRVQAVVNNGDTDALSKLLQRKRITQKMYDDAYAQIQKVQQKNEEANKKYNELLKSYVKDVSTWKKANGIDESVFPGAPPLSTQEFEGGPADWTKAPFGTPSAVDALNALKNGDADIARRGVGIATDGDQIEDLDVRVMRVLDQDGYEQLEVKFKLTSWAGDALKDHISTKSGVTKDSKMRLKDRTIDPQSGLPKYLNSDKFTLPGTTYTYVDSATGAKVEFSYEGSSQINSSALHNQVRIWMPPDSTAEDYGKALESLGITQANPARDEDIRRYAENRLMTLVGMTDPTKNLTDPTARKNKLAEVESRYGITIDDLHLGSYHEGHIKLYLSDEARDKVKQYTNLSGLHHTIHGGSSAEKWVRILSGPQAGVHATNIRWAEGIGESGMSSSSDMHGSGGNFIYTRPLHGSHKQAVSGPSVVMHPLAAARRIDMYANQSDNGTGKHYNGRELYEIMKGHPYEVQVKSGIPLSEFWYIVANSSNERAAVIQMLHARGITEINGIPLEQFILTAGMDVPQIDEALYSTGNMPKAV